MSTPDDIRQQQELLAPHRRTLAHYLQQQAALGNAYAPPGIAHGIYEARTAITHIKATLRAWGVAIDDHPNDAEAPTPPAAQPAPPATGDTINAQGAQGFVNRPTGPVNQHFGNVIHGVTITGGTVQGPVTGVNYGTVQHQPGGGAPPPRAGGDPMASYEAGLQALLARLGPAHPRYNEVLVYEQRLREVIAQSRLYGDTNERSATRNEVISRLNDLALATVGVSFNELCP